MKNKIELYNIFIGYLSKYNTNELPLKEEINSEFIKKLNIPLNKINLFNFFEFTLFLWYNI